MPTSIRSAATRGLSALVLSAVSLAALPACAAKAEPPSEAIEPADSLEGNFLAAYIAGASRDTAAATIFYREAIKADPRNQELVERAFVAFLADGALPEAFKAAERLVAKDASNGLAQLALGVRSIKGRQYAAARTQLSKSGRGRQADVTSTLLTAWTWAGSGDGKRALETVDRLRSERAYAVFRDYHAGLISEIVGNTAEAERRLKTAYDQDPRTLRVVDAYARFQSRQGNRQAAVAAYEAFDKLLPRHPVVRAALDQLRAGQTLAPLVASAQEGAAEVLYGLGAAGNGQGDELPAIVYLRLALSLNGDHPLALVTLADIYERLKQYDQAIDVLNRVPKDSPLRPSSEVQIALNYEQLGRGEDAVRHLETLAKERPNDIEAVTALGNVLRARKRFPEAAEAYSRAIAQIPSDEKGYWSLYFYRGTAYERAKQWDKAEADLKKALELVPDTQPNGKAQALNYLAYSWVDMGVNIDEAFKMLQRAVELSPRDGMVIDSLGWAYYRLGRYDDAVRELEKAVDLKPGDPVINDHLGDAYWKVGRKLEARFQWDHAKTANPEHDDLLKILHKIDHGLDEAKPTAAENRPPDLPKAEPANDGG